MFEKSGVEQQEDKFDSIGLWNDLLALFGTKEAVERFKNLCERYYRLVATARLHARESHIESIEISIEGRAKLHQMIMDTLYDLMNQVRLPPEKAKRFRPLADRNKVKTMIEDVFGHHSPAEQEKIRQMTPLGRFRKEIN